MSKHMAAGGFARVEGKRGLETASPQELSNGRLAILCDVLEGRGANLTPVKKNVLDQLIAKGFVTASDQASSAKYKLTGKAQQLLAERGVGLSGG